MKARKRSSTSCSSTAPGPSDDIEASEVLNGAVAGRNLRRVAAYIGYGVTADVTHPDRPTAPMCAVKHSQLDIAQLLLDAGHDIYRKHRTIWIEFPRPDAQYAQTCPT